MQRTPLGRRFAAQLALVNDQTIYSAFADHEFTMTVEHLADQTPTAYTHTAFPTNPASQRLNIRLTDLRTIQTQVSRGGFKSGVMAATEHALAYLDELYAFRKAVSPDDKDGPKPDDESDEDAALRRLRAWGAVEPEVYFFRTIGHFRHLRNHYAHLNQSLNQPFSRHINHYSHQLQRFWADRGTITLGFDFTRRDVDAIDLDISLAAMNLLRASIREVDTIFASTLRLEHVLRAEFDEAYQDNPTHHRNAEKLASKVRTKLERNYGELFDAHVVTLRVKEILDTR